MSRIFVGIAALFSIASGCVAPQRIVSDPAPTDSNAGSNETRRGVGTAVGVAQTEAWTIEVETDPLTDETTARVQTAGTVLSGSDAAFDSFTPVIVVTCGSENSAPMRLQLAAVGTDGQAKLLSAGYGMLRVDKRAVHEAPWRSRPAVSVVEFDGDIGAIFEDMRRGRTLLLRVQEDAQRLNASFPLATFGAVAAQFERTCRPNWAPSP